MNFRNTSLVFFLLLLVFNFMKLIVCPCDLPVIGFFCRHPAWFYGTLSTLYLIIPVLLSFYPCSQFHYNPVICKGITKAREVVLTFDDGPHPEFTPLILETLRRHSIKAGFFIIGKHIPGNENIIKAMNEDGHVFGNHSFTHSHLWDFWTPARIHRDIMKTASLISDITGKNPEYFRPPYGVINPMVSKAIRMTSYRVVAWSKRSLDTLARDPEVLLQRITRNLKGGDIILLHDNQEITANILEKLIQEINNKGFRIVPLDRFTKNNSDG